MRDPALLFKALSDETRLQMLVLIRQHQELCVCDLENVLDIGQSKASRHLRYLLNAGLLQDRREAVWIYYRISEKLSPGQRAVLESIDQLIEPETLAELSAKLVVWRDQKKCGIARGKSGPKTIILERTL